MRSLDMLTDWSFYAISLRNYGTFHYEYSGNVMELRDASFVFCLLGLLMWIPDMYAYMTRATGLSQGGQLSDARRTFPIKMTLLVFFLEDLPQLAIQSVYLDTVGVENDGIALVSLVLSLMSMTYNVQLFVREMCKHPDALSVGWITEGTRGVHYIANACALGATVCFSLATAGAITAYQNVLEAFPWAYVYERTNKNYADREMTESKHIYFGLTHAAMDSTSSVCASGDDTLFKGVLPYDGAAAHSNVDQWSEHHQHCADMNLSYCTYVGLASAVPLALLILLRKGNSGWSQALFCILAAIMFSCCVASMAIFDSLCYQPEVVSTYSDFVGATANHLETATVWFGHGLCYKLECLALLLYLVAGCLKGRLLWKEKRGCCTGENEYTANPASAHSVELKVTHSFGFSNNEIVSNDEMDLYGAVRRNDSLMSSLPPGNGADGTPRWSDAPWYTPDLTKERAISALQKNPAAGRFWVRKSAGGKREGLADTLAITYRAKDRTIRHVRIYVEKKIKGYRFNLPPIRGANTKFDTLNSLIKWHTRHNRADGNSLGVQLVLSSKFARTGFEATDDETCYSQNTPNSKQRAKSKKQSKKGRRRAPSNSNQTDAVDYAASVTNSNAGGQDSEYLDISACRYKSSRGGCRHELKPGSQFCDLHTCPMCLTKSKSSQSNTCEDCQSTLADFDAEPEAHEPQQRIRETNMARPQRFASAMSAVGDFLSVGRNKSEFEAQHQTLKPIVKKLYLRGPGPFILLFFALVIPVIIGLAYGLGPGITIDLSPGSFQVQGHQVSRSVHALNAALPHCAKPESCHDQKCPLDGESVTRHRRSHNGSTHHSHGTPKRLDDHGTPLLDTSGETSWTESVFDLLFSQTVQGRRQRRGRKGFPVALVYFVQGQRGANMLTPTMIREVRGVEAKVARFFNKQVKQWPNAKGKDELATLTRFAYNDAWASEEPELVSDSELQGMLDYAYAGNGETKPGWPQSYGKRVLAFGSSPYERRSIPTAGANVTRWYTGALRSQLNVPQSSYDNTVLETWANFLQGLSTDDVEVVYVSMEIFNYQIRSALKSDLTKAGIALGFVAFWTLLHTFSPFLTLMGILNLILAFPPAYFLYTAIFGVQALSILTPVTLLVVIGIAIDDVFVFVDTFKQCEKNLDPELRMARTIATAARATLFTTVTSASAFFANYLSEIPALANFGLFTALVIVTNYIWLLMLIPLSLGVWGRYLEGWGAMCAGSDRAYQTGDENDGGDDDDDEQQDGGVCAACYKALLRLSPVNTALTCLARIVTNHRKKIAFVYMMVFAVFMGFAGTLQFAEEPPSLVPEGSDADKAVMPPLKRAWIPLHAHVHNC